MGDLLLRGVPDAIKTELTEIAKADGQSLSQKAIDVLRKGMAAERLEQEKEQPRNAWDMLRSAFEMEGPVTGEFAAIMDEIEAQNKRDFGRPIDRQNSESV